MRVSYCAGASAAAGRDAATASGGPWGGCVPGGSRRNSVAGSSVRRCGALPREPPRPFWRLLRVVCARSVLPQPPPPARPLLPHAALRICIRCCCLWCSCLVLLRRARCCPAAAARGPARPRCAALAPPQGHPWGRNRGAPACGGDPDAPGAGPPRCRCAPPVRGLESFCCARLHPS